MLQKQANRFISLALSVFVCMLASTTQAYTQDTIKPIIITEPTRYDTDDPAVWVNKANPSESLIIGTDKNTDGALYVYNMKGKIIQDKVIHNLNIPNNVDVAYGLPLQGKATDFAITTERMAGKLRVFSLPDMKEIDNGGIPVFVGETTYRYNEPMGIAVYTNPSDHRFYAIVSRKAGPTNGTYLWEYLLEDDGTGNVKGTLVRKFGKFSGHQEIEAVAVDNELGYVYYSDEATCIRKYYADPQKGNDELAVFGTSGFTASREGISIYKIDDGTGYILVSDQSANRFQVFPREGAGANANNHPLLKVVYTQTVKSDGSETVNFPILPDFPNGLFIAMSTNRTFQLYRWESVAGKDLKIQPPATGTPAIPQLLSPANAATGISIPPTLSWQASSGAASYQVQVSTLADFSSTAFDQGNITATSVSIPGLTESTTYYWHVRSANTSGTSDWSSAWHFTTKEKTTDQTAPTVVSILRQSPATQNTSATSVIFRTTFSESVRGVDVSDFTTTVTSGTLSSTLSSITAVGTAGTTYDISITNISGTGTLRLDVKTSATISDAAGNALTGGYSAGETYNISPSTTQQVTSFTLVNAGTEKDIQPLSDGAVINMAQMPSTKLNIRANTSPATVGSVKFVLTGPQNQTYTDNAVPYALFGDDGKGNYYYGIWNPPALGSYTLKATPYTGSKATGTAGTALTINFTIVNQASSITTNRTDGPTEELHTELQASPNPFSGRTTVSFVLPEDGQYTVGLYNMAGKQIALLKEGKDKARTLHTVEVNGSGLTDGAYVVRVQTKEGTKTLKLMLLQ